MSALLAGAGLFFWLVVYAAAYRGRRQDVRNPAIVHVLFTGGGCILAGAGLMLLAWAVRGVELPLPEAALALVGSTGAFMGMGAVAVPIWWYLPAIAAQPVDADLALERGKRMALEVEVERLRRERNRWQRKVIMGELLALKADSLMHEGA